MFYDFLVQKLAKLGGKSAEITVRILQFRKKHYLCGVKTISADADSKITEPVCIPQELQAGHFFMLYGQSETKNRTRTPFHPEKQGDVVRGRRESVVLFVTGKLFSSEILLDGYA